VNVDGGLKGISGSTSDMRDLLARAPSDPRAALAIDVFCYQAAKAVGALCTALGGLDALVFTGGIGEHGSEIRRRIVEQVEWLGIEIDADHNDASSSVLSKPGSPVELRVVRTDEELVLARHARDLMARRKSD